MKKSPLHPTQHHVRKYTESYKGLSFLAAFVGTLLIITVYMNGSDVANEARLNIHGFKTGAAATYKFSGQANKEYQRKLAAIQSSGAPAGAMITGRLGNNGWLTPSGKEQGIKTATWLTNYLSQGQHLTSLNQSQARALQKSILTTYYLGEKTVDINSAFALDFKILKSLNNTLSVDIFQYLNQAENRADALDEYLHLMNQLESQSVKRVQELDERIHFLQSNFLTQEAQIQRSETDFFNNLRTFNAPNAEQELSQFIGLSASSSEARAKIGAYQGIRDYYAFFLPKLNNLTTAIRANRDALIAGVKVVEIRNMTLPLIIRQR